MSDEQSDQNSCAVSASTKTPETFTIAEQYSKKEQWRIMKNVIAISASFLCLFTAFQSMSSLQSSINSEKNLGTKSLVTIYVSLILSCLFLPSLVLKTLTCKWTMVASALCYSTYMIAQFYPISYTMLPAGVLLGFAAAPLWSAKCTYLTQTGTVLAEILGKPSEPIVVRFFGIFFLFFQSSQIAGNLIAYLVLRPDDGGEIANTPNAAADSCGFSFNPTTNETNENLKRPDSAKIYTLAGVFLCLALGSCALLAFFVDPLKRYGEMQRKNNSGASSPLSLVAATVMHLKKPYQMLIVPLTMWSGFEQGFLTAEYTMAYVTCTIGVHHVGTVLIVYGICDAVGSLSFGFVIKKVGRIPIFVLGALINYIVIIIMIQWRPNDDQRYMFYLIAGLWGVADAVWQTQINAFYGVIFPDSTEAAFSNYRLWESLGFAISFGISGAVAIPAKLYNLLVFLTAGMIGYLLIEVLQWRKARAKLVIKS